MLMQELQIEKYRRLERNNASLNYEWMLLPLYCECDGSINWGCLTFISNSGPRYIFLYIINSDVTYAVGVVFVVFFFFWPNLRFCNATRGKNDNKRFEPFQDQSTLYSTCQCSSGQLAVSSVAKRPICKVKNAVAQTTFPGILYRYKKWTLVAFWV